jgi:hypothetical protein
VEMPAMEMTAHISATFKLLRLFNFFRLLESIFNY